MRKAHLFRRQSRLLRDYLIQTSLSITEGTPEVREAYLRMVHHVLTCSTLLRAGSSPGSPWSLTMPHYALYTMTCHHASWLRPVEHWQPTSTSPHPQLASLAHHLFALYPMPACMTSAWYSPHGGFFTPEQEWYKHLGRGKSLRTAGLPLSFTRGMVRHFMEAPHHYSVKEGLRWAQVRALGGGEDLARAIARSRLGSQFANEDFWLTVLRFFVHHPTMDLCHVAPIIEFLQAQRFQTREVFVPGEGIVPQGPPRPDYSVKGRTVASLLRQLEGWEKARLQERNSRYRHWPRSAVGELRLLEGADEPSPKRCWTIQEVLTSMHLIQEGQALRHCVASYIPLCASGATSIWSMRVDWGDGPRRALTVEVDPRKRLIRRARGSANRRPRPIERAVLKRWAQQEGLEIAESL